MADTSDTGSDAPETDDMRKRFQEALERKKQASHATGAAGAGGDGGKGHGGSGPAKAQRTFRRKSGG